MKATELRIGNWITVGGSNPIQITGIFKEYIWALVQETDFPLADIQGILITQEWLLKFGFRYTEEDVWRDQYINHRIHLYGDPFKNGWTVENIDPHFEIRFIHQLQNLYFAIAGEELELEQ